MVDQKKIDRINELARKNKTEGLTPEEIKERVLHIDNKDDKE